MTSRLHMSIFGYCNCWFIIHETKLSKVLVTSTYLCHKIYWYWNRKKANNNKESIILLILSSLICVCSYLPTSMICMMSKDHPFCIQVRFHREVLIHEQDCLLSYESMCFLMTNLKSSWMDVLPKRPKWTKKNFINQDKRNDVINNSNASQYFRKS